MHTKALATELGDALKYHSTINNINRTARAIFPCSLKNFDNDSITSKCAKLIYDWILTISSYTISNERKEDLVVDFAKRITPKELMGDVAELFNRNGISERKFDGLVSTIVPAPSFGSLMSSLPALEKIIVDRWIEAQKCQKAGAYLASVILMGSILEALLFSRACVSRSESYKANSAPKDRKFEVQIKIEDWKLNDLIEVAVELEWMKVDRGAFSHALRQSRNIVHPWQQMSEKADFDEHTCRTCWQVLTATINDITR